jgi:transketolase
MPGIIRNSFGEAVVMRKAYGDALVELGKARRDVVVLSADVSNSDFSYMFEAEFPERFFNVGIAEPALVETAVGLANSGYVPIANTFAFLLSTRAVEMVRTHLCYGGANVKLAGAYAGLSDSFDGPTHHSITDLAILRSLPNMTVVAPADPLAGRGSCRKLPRGADRSISGSAAMKSRGSLTTITRPKSAAESRCWMYGRNRDRVRCDALASCRSGAHAGGAGPFDPGCRNAHHQAAGWRVSGTVRA